MSIYSKETELAKKETLDAIANDVLKPVNIGLNFKVWMGFLSIILLACIIAYAIQLDKGLIVTGLRDITSWGMYISNFVFFVATSLVGMLISAVLGLIGIKWIKPLTRIAEIIAVSFAAVAGLVIISDMGRPDRFLNLFMYGRLQSPILWDVTVVNVYLIVSLLLYFFTLIPDLAISVNNRMNDKPAWLQKVYSLLSLNWVHSPEQYHLLHKMIRILLIIIVPVAFAIHTVTSWLFAVTLRPGWDSTIFGPYFLSGAFVAGVGALLIAMYVFRKSYDLQEYITEMHFDKVSKLLVLVAVVYLYFNINEYLVPAYKMKKADGLHFETLFFGAHAFLFWTVQIFGLILPIILLLFKQMRKPGPAMVIGIFVLIGSWFKRLIIVVPTMEHPFLPVQGVPLEYHIYTPTIIETAVTIGTITLALMMITVLSKVFPVIPMWEIAKDVEQSKENK